MDDLYCALCGVCFDVYTDLYHGRLSSEDTSWTSYFQYRELSSPSLLKGTSGIMEGKASCALFGYPSHTFEDTSFFLQLFLAHTVS